MQPSELQRLLEKYKNNTITAEEFRQLWATLGEERFDSYWHELAERTLNDQSVHNLSDQEQMAGQLAQIRAIIRPKPRIYRIARYAAAAVILLAFGAYIITRNTNNQPRVAAVTPKSADKIKPGTQKAMLTLADGTVVTLDSMTNGKIAQQGATQVLKLASGQIRYQAADAKDQQGNIAYNVMSTPMGGQYQLTLPDGSNVWLNAGSSITYPTAFPGNKREVKITGEVYFEVAKDKNKTFRVTAGDQVIEVLGTHFNINAYPDEDHIKTSLLEGAVKVNKVLLQPGQAFTKGKIEPTNVDQDIAWKNGEFNFNNQTLAQVMRQLARWYDLEIVYPQGIPQKEYGGEIGRNLTLDQVLKGLENSGIHFQLNGRRLMVKS
ncbi:MAG TPA: FecR family protein [Puia sp.]|jgi:ferric-dicitrate binding protein FerR (iron transport regulator)